MKFFRFSPESSWYLVFSLLNACIASAICLSNFPGDALFWSIQSLLFSVTASFAHFFFLFCFLSLPFWYAGKLFKRSIHRIYLVVGIHILILTVVYLDARIFELYKFHLNGMVLELITGGALQDILSFNLLTWSLFAAIALILVALQFILGKIVWAFCQGYSQSKVIALLALILFSACALISQGIYIISDAKGDPTITSLKRYIPWAQTITAKRRLRELGVEIKESNNQELNYTSHEIYYPKAGLRCEPEKKYNVLVVVVDSLRWDMLDQEIMPETWELAKNSHIYNNHYSQANATRFGIFTLMYGLPGSYWHSILNIQKGTVLFDYFIQENYDFHIYSAAPLFSPEFDRTVFVRVKDQINTGPSNVAAFKKDQYITKSFRDAINSQEKNNPFFGFLFFDSPHSYSYPKSFKEPFTPSWDKINYLKLDGDFEPSKFFNRYKNSAAYTDKLFGKVITKLESRNLLEDTIVVFTSDHGQEFNETGMNFWGHNGNFSRYQTQVPFFIHWPENHPLHGSQSYQQQTSNMDVVPTLMKEAFACSNPISDFSLGLNLYAPQNDYGRPLAMESWSKRAIMGKNYILVSHDAGGTEIFDRDYKPLEDFTPPQEDFSIIFKQLSAFKKSSDDE